MTETFKDALMLSNKTYFLEEVNKHKLEKKKLQHDVKIAHEKIRIMQKTINYTDA